MPLRRLDYRPYPFEILSTILRFDLDPETTVVQSFLRIKRKEGDEFSGEPLVLNGKDLELRSLKIDGESVLKGQYEIVGENLTVKNVPDDFLLFVSVAIHPEKNTTGSGLYYAGGMFTTQCEPDSFRKITYYPDRPDVMSLFEVGIIADREKFPVLLSNGNPVSLTDMEDGKRVAVWNDPWKKPSYLFALVAGDLSYTEDKWITSPSSREVTIRVISTKENVESGQCEHALRSIKKSMEYDERRWGREYDLDLFMVVATSTFNMGAMENKGLNIFNVKVVLASPETATDADHERIEGVIGHEYFHNWSGDRVTVRDWFQLSLKEGLTVYRDQEFSRERWGIRKEISDMIIMKTHQFSEDASPLAHPIRLDEAEEMENFYTVTVYEKGAEVIRMTEVLLGKEKFREAMDLYFTRHDGEAATCEDFVKAMEDASGMDLSQFRRWYDFAGTPEVEIVSAYCSANKRLGLFIRQNTPDTPKQTDKPPMMIPFVVGLVGKDWSAEKTLVLTKREEDFFFDDVPEEPALSLNRRFAPVRVKYEYSADELEFLAAHDPYPIARWNAVQTLGKEVLLKLTEDVKAGRRLVCDERLKKVFRAILEEKWTNLHLFGAILKLPSEDEIANESEKINPDAIHKARKFLVSELAKTFYPEFILLYSGMETDWDVPTRFEPEDIAKREIANVALSYLSSLKHCVCFVRGQFWRANNMTDKFAALSEVVGNHFDFADHMLSEFYDRFKNYENVVGKWLAVQSGDIGKVQALLRHEAFDIKNPNKVRALIGSFAASRAFHKASGEGYKFFADFILEYDRVNPCVASRLVEPLTKWRRYCLPWRARMLREVLRINKDENLSRGTREKIAKSLEGLSLGDRFTAWLFSDK